MKPYYVVERYDKKKFPVYIHSIDKEQNADGLCYCTFVSDTNDTHSIEIEKDLKPKRMVDVMIEEVCHAFFNKEPEYKVRKFSKELGNLLVKKFDITN